MEFWVLLFPQISPEPCFWEKTGVGPSCFIQERESKKVAVGLEELLAPGFPLSARVKLCDLGRRYFSLSP